MDKVKLKTLLIFPNTTLKESMQKLNETAEKILFVVGKNYKLVGTITDGDIRRGIINSMKFNARVEKIMNKKFIAVPYNMPDIGKRIKQVMIKSGIEQIPVLDDKGIILDVILWTDILGEKKRLTSAHLHPNQVVIMAGGKGKRLDPFTRILPKPLIPIGDKPVIELIMEKFYQYGFHKYIYTLNYKKEYIKAFLRENKYSYQIDLVEEDDFLGTAGSLSLLKDRIKDTFFVTNCDSLLIDVNFEDMLNWHIDHKASITVIGCHNEFKIPFGVIELSNGRLEKIVEKPVHDIIINTGVYIMEPHIISYIQEGTKVDMNEVIDSVAKKEKITVYPIYGNWLDIGQWEQYNKTVEQLKLEVDVV